MIRVLRIAALTASLVGILVASGAVGLVGADEQSVPQQSGAVVPDLDCGGDPVVLIQSDGHYVPTRPGRPAEGPQSDRAALVEFLRQERIPISSASFSRSAREGRRSQFVYRRGNGGLAATAFIRAIGETYYVPSFAACDSVASREGKER